jgi:hypothetical protein
MASASESPSVSPSRSPSVSPSASPSRSPSSSPSVSPSASPSPMPAGEVIYVVRDKSRIGRKRLSFVQITFGGSNDLYPSGGVPLTAGKMGMVNLDAVIPLEGNGSGINYEFDKSACTIRIFPTYGTEMATGATLSETILEVMAIGF